MDLARNRKAHHDYHVLEKYEAGIVLVGTEVKSCRAHNISMVDAYASFNQGEMWLHNVHIAHYEQGNRNNHEPTRARKLLLHKAEIRKLVGAINKKGLSLVPLAFYLKHGKIKVSIGLCRGKTHGDKRETLKKRQADMDMRKAMKR